MVRYLKVRNGVLVPENEDQPKWLARILFPYRARFPVRKYYSRANIICANVIYLRDMMSGSEIIFAREYY